MLRYILLPIWYIVVTLLIIPLLYCLKLVVILLVTMWDYKLFPDIIEDTYWGGFSSENSFGRIIQYSWSQLYSLKL